MNRFIFLVVISFLSVICCANDTSPPYKCAICKQKKSHQCAVDPKNLPPQDCKNLFDGNYTCITYIDKNNLTIRGCGTGDLSKDFKDAKDPNLTFNCKNKNPNEACNMDVFPPNRQKCYVSTNQGEVSSLCAIYKEKAECFALKMNNTHTKGCVDEKDSNEAECTKYSAACKKCIGNECNKDHEVKCFKCNGNDCKRTVFDCKTISTEKLGTCSSSEGCYTLQRGNEVIRGCLGDFHGSSDGLKTCTDSACNGECIKDITKCFKCDSNSNSTCKEPPDENLLDRCQPYNSACYFCEDQDEIFYRGCGQPANNTYSCSYCYDEKCKPEKLPGRSCFKCDSSKDGFKCVVGEDFMMSSFCKEEKDDCVVLIKDGNTIRGCVKEILGEKDDCPKGTCNKCGKHNCNRGIFPADRRQCFQCAKGINCLNEPEGDMSKPCLKYDPEEKCYMYAIEHEMYRGCKSDADNADKCKSPPEKDKPPCVTCNKNSCNRSPYEKLSSIKCFKCKDDEECVWGQDPEKAVVCEGHSVKYYEVEKCYTSIITQNNKTEVQRGCAADSDACKEPGPGCQICDSEICNQKNFMQFTCIRCRSDDPDMEKCANVGNAIGVPPSNCSNENMQKTEKGCYTRNFRGATVRGCFADLDLKRREVCKDSKKHICDFCPEVNCNNKTVPSSSSIISFSYILLIISIVPIFAQ